MWKEGDVGIVMMHRVVFLALCILAEITLAITAISVLVHDAVSALKEEANS